MTIHGYQHSFPYTTSVYFEDTKTHTISILFLIANIALMDKRLYPQPHGASKSIRTTQQDRNVLPFGYLSIVIIHEVVAFVIPDECYKQANKTQQCT